MVATVGIWAVEIDVARICVAGVAWDGAAGAAAVAEAIADGATLSVVGSGAAGVVEPPARVTLKLSALKARGTPAGAPGAGAAAA